MKLITYQIETLLGRFDRLGAYLTHPAGLPPWVVDLNATYAAYLQHYQLSPCPQRLANTVLPSHMLSFIQMGKTALDAAKVSMDWLAERWQPESPLPVGIYGESLLLNEDQFRLLAPLPRPNSVRDFMAFEDHMKAGSARRNIPVPPAWYEFPVYYKGNPDTIVGPHVDIFWPHYTQKLDFELEMACIIGKQGKNIPAEQASEAIFGFSVLNDFSAREVQLAEMTCRLGPAKGKDFATGLGPCIITWDELGTYRGLKMQAHINGKLFKEASTDLLYWSFEQMIERVSQEETLYPGDLLGSGTPFGGCGLDQDQWLQPGDTIALTIEKIGTLQHRVIRPAVGAETTPTAMPARLLMAEGV
jgi:2-keto-4-pentenoate hydratase/2-oxohepta-3-ene-1,7-dioic acid hydratase in catechol pathway